MRTLDGSTMSQVLRDRDKDVDQNWEKSCIAERKHALGCLVIVHFSVNDLKQRAKTGQVTNRPRVAKPQLTNCSCSI